MLTLPQTQKFCIELTVCKTFFISAVNVGLGQLCIILHLYGLGDILLLLLCLFPNHFTCGCPNEHFNLCKVTPMDWSLSRTTYKLVSYSFLISWTRVSSCYLLCLSIECSLPQAKGRGAEKNMALGARFQKLTLLSGGAGFSEGQGGAKFSERVRFWKATMFFCKRVICVALL